MENQMENQINSILTGLAGKQPIDEVKPISTTSTISTSFIPIGNKLNLKPGFAVDIDIHDFIKLLEDNDISSYAFRATSDIIDMSSQGSKYVDYNRDDELGLYIYLGQNTNEVYETLTDLHGNLEIDEIPDNFTLVKSLKDTTYSTLYNLFGDKAKISYGSISDIIFSEYWLIVDLDEVPGIVAQLNY